MKNLNLFSLLLMASMLLFFGGCQREDELFTKLNNEESSLLLIDSTILKKFMVPGEEFFIQGGRSGEDVASYDSLNKICDLIINQDSSHHFLVAFIRKFGYPAWLKSFEINEERGQKQIISIPFVKDSIVTGVLQYHSICGENGLIFFSKEQIYDLIQTNLQEDKNFELAGIFSYIISQVKCFDKIDITLKNWLKLFQDENILANGNNGSRFEECIELCGWWADSEHLANQGGTVFWVWHCITLCYRITPDIDNDRGNYDFPTGSSEWWNGINNSSSGSSTSSGDGGTNNNNDQLQKEAEERKKKEIEACVNTQSDVATEAMLNEAVEDLIFPCENFISTRLKKAALKAEIKQKWCEDQYDNPGTKQPDGTYIKPKMTEDDIDAALEVALEGVDYINLDEIPIHKTDCSKTDEQNISDFKNYMQQNGGCTETGFQDGLENFLGIRTTLDPTKPVLSINKSICGDIFNVTPHDSKPNTFVTGISDLQFSFSVPGTNLPLQISFANLHFENNATNCQFSFSTAVANSINSAVATMQAQITAGGKLNRSELYKLIHRAYQKELEHCTPHHGTAVGNVSLLSDGSPNCGGVDYSVLDNDDCP